MDTKDGQYESCVRERINLTPIPGRPARGLSPNVTIDFGTFFLLTTGRSVFWGVKRLKKQSIWGPDLEQAQIGENRTQNAPI